MVPSRIELLKSGVKVAGFVRDDLRQAGIPPRGLGSGGWVLHEYGLIGSNGSLLSERSPEGWVWGLNVEDQSKL